MQIIMQTEIIFIKQYSIHGSRYDVQGWSNLLEVGVNK